MESLLDIEPEIAGRLAGVRAFVESFPTQKDAAQAIHMEPARISKALSDPTDRKLAPIEIAISKWKQANGGSGSEKNTQNEAPHILTDVQSYGFNSVALSADTIQRRLAVIRRITPQGQPTGDGILADRAEVELRAGAAADKLGYYTMPSDAMDGVIPPGAPLDVTPGDYYSGPGIYMMILGGRPTVGYLQGKADGSWRVAYANAAYEADLFLPDGSGGYVAAESGLPVTLEIVGQVRGTYRRLG